MAGDLFTIDSSIFEQEPEDDKGTTTGGGEVEPEKEKKAAEPTNTLVVDTSEFEGDTDSEENNGVEPPKSKGTSSSPITSLTSALYEEGVLASLTEEEIAEIKSGEDLLKVIKEQIRNNEFSDLNEDQKEYLKALRNGVPEEDFRTLKQQVSQISSLKVDDLKGEESSELRMAILKQDFLSRGFDEADATKHAKRSVDLGEDEEDAAKALVRIQATEKAKLKQLAEEAEARKKAEEEASKSKVNSIKEKITNTQEIIPGVKFNARTKDKVFELMTKTVDHDKNNNPVNAVVKEMISNPDYLIKLYYLHHVTDGLKDWSKVKSGGKTEAVERLENTLREQDAKITTGASTRARGSNNSNSDIVNFLNSLGK